MSNSEFIKMIGESAVKFYDIYKILPSLTIAQAILESNWGKSKLSLLAYNYFGMKAGSGWTGNIYNSATKEQTAAGSVYTVSANFRAYANTDEGIKGYYEFLQYARYKNLKGVTDYKRACSLIKTDGWATDINYTTKLVGLIEKYGLTDYDKRVLEEEEMVECKNMCIDGKVYKNINQINKDGRIYVELASLKGCGYNVGFDANSKVASMAKAPETLKMLVNDKEIEVKRELIYSENYIRLKDFEKVGMKVKYDEVKKQPVLEF